MTDADGRTWRFQDKPSVFDAKGGLGKDSNYPVPVTIRVRIIEEAEPLTVSTDPVGAASKEGETTFRVPSSIVEL